MSSYETAAWAKVLTYLSVVTHFEPFSKGRPGHQGRHLLPFRDLPRAVPHGAIDGISSVEGLSHEIRLGEGKTNQVHGLPDRLPAGGAGRSWRRSTGSPTATTSRTTPRRTSGSASPIRPKRWSRVSSRTPRSVTTTGPASSPRRATCWTGMTTSRPGCTVAYVDPDKKPQVAKADGVRTYGTIFVEANGKKEEAKSLTEEEVTGALIRALKGGERTVCAVVGQRRAQPRRHRAHRLLQPQGTAREEQLQDPDDLAAARSRRCPRSAPS